MKITGLFVILALAAVVLSSRTEIGTEQLRDNSALLNNAKPSDR
jgi:hypothetical protein